MLSNCDARDAHQDKFQMHPHNLAVDREYEALTQAWKDELIDNTPTTPNKDYVRLAWMRLMDHYLDQHWLDSKQMLQCAQAWSAREELSLTEAVHTMNILSLKSMQRSLDARQELLQALCDPDLMGFGVSQERFSTISTMSCLNEAEDIHAPLLMSHQKNAPSEKEDILIQEAQDIPEETFAKNNPTMTNDSAMFKQEELNQEIKSRHVFEGHTEEQEAEEEENDSVSPIESLTYSRSLSSSVSSPTISHSFHSGLRERKYESYYPSWRDSDVNQDIDLMSENGNRSSGTLSRLSQHSHSPLKNGVQWKSWFVGNEHPSTLAFANEKVETDDTFSDFQMEQQPNITKQSFLMVRSESSISAFRPISNNLAPRCQATTSDPIIMTKSKSFPTKAALGETPPPPVPQQRNFMRSIVNKKVSLTKLFGHKKSST